MPERLTQAEAWALVEEHGGNKAAAARAHGVNRHTLRYWLDPEPQKAKVKARRLADPEKHRAMSRRYWSEKKGPAYSLRLLQMRRVKALHRMAERKRRQAERPD